MNNPSQAIKKKVERLATERLEHGIREGNDFYFQYIRESLPQHLEVIHSILEKLELSLPAYLEPSLLEKEIDSQEINRRAFFVLEFGDPELGIPPLLLFSKARRATRKFIREL